MEHTLRGKTILWLGTSIPEGHDLGEKDPDKRKTYPDVAGEILGARIINQALGASMARANVLTGDFVRGSAYSLTRSLSQTLEEKEYLIEHWEEINRLVKNPEIYPDSLEQVKDVKVRPASFERKLLPYLDGREELPDLFVLDHGHNDVQFSSPDPAADIAIQPTPEAIRAGEIAEDRYMTRDHCSNLKRFLGDLSGIPEEEFDSFVASLNRNCFVGAMNFLCTLILHHHPRAKIVFIGNLDDHPKRAHLIETQEKLARSWGFPIIEPWRELGLGHHRIPGTATFWEEDGTTDLIQKRLYCRDGVHPHTDTTGETIALYGRIVARELEKIVY